MVHAKSVHEGYDEWRERQFRPEKVPEFGCGTAMMHFMDQFEPRFRQTPSLRGIAGFDAVTEADLTAAASAGEALGVSGRIARDVDGRPGRYGWKGQVSTLRTFVEQACANEIGLTTPTVAQPEDPNVQHAMPAGIDLNAEQVDSLVAFVASLPAPAPAATDAGQQHFESAGCTACHTARIGPVQGAYTDLLLHDMGHALSDAASGYGGPIAGAPTTTEAGEWRTPPLWDLATSAPYLHDGRAPTLDDAITAHGGEAIASRDAYLALSGGERKALLAFLGGLGSPATPEEAPSK